MTEREALKLALEALKRVPCDAKYEQDCFACNAEEAIKEALAQPEQESCGGCGGSGWIPRDPDIGTDQECFVCGGSGAYPKEPEQEPVAMKFKIYKPTVPDPTRQGINNALLPWVYDQDRNSGFDATMWVTPVSTLPPQRKPLTDEEIGSCIDEVNLTSQYGHHHFGWHKQFARAIEQAHGIKELA